MSEFFNALERARRERAEGRSLPRAPESPAPTAARGPLAHEPVATEAAAAFDRRTPLLDVSPDIDPHLVSLLTPGAYEVEPYLVLRHTVERLHRESRVTTVGVTSPGPGEGKTTTAINLAGALALDKAARVLLIDADLREPAVAARLGERDVPGLVDVVSGERALLDVAVERHPFNLHVLPAAPGARSPYEIVVSSAFAELVAAAREAFDYVILDLPPVAPYPDVRVMDRCIDAFFVVVAAHLTTRAMLEETLDAMDPAKAAGLVFNGDDAAHAAYGYRESARAAERRLGGGGRRPFRRGRRGAA